MPVVERKIFYNFAEVCPAMAWPTGRVPPAVNYYVRKTVGQKITKVLISPCRTDGQKTLYWTENRAHDSSECVKRVIAENN